MITMSKTQLEELIDTLREGYGLGLDHASWGCSHNTASREYEEWLTQVIKRLPKELKK